MSPQIPLILPFGLLGGCILGAVFLLWVRRLGRWENAVLAAGLEAAALLYLTMAWLGRGSRAEIQLEFVGVVVFTLLALVGLRWWPTLLGIGWLLHAGWDILVHWPPQPWVPVLYPLSCVAFDLVIAAYFLFLATLREEA